MNKNKFANCKVEMFTTLNVCDKGKQGDLWIRYEDYLDTDIKISRIKENLKELLELLER